jgi:hypothetical protein
MKKALLGMVAIAAAASTMLVLVGPPVPKSWPSWPEVVETSRTHPENIILVVAIIVGWTMVFAGFGWAISTMIGEFTSSLDTEPLVPHDHVATPTAADPGSKPTLVERLTKKKRLKVDEQRSVTLDVETGGRQGPPPGY